MSSVVKQTHGVQRLPRLPGLLYAHRDLVIIVSITLLALLQRFSTMGRIDPGISTDEFHYAVVSQEITDILRDRSSFQMRDVYGFHSLLKYLVGVLALLLPVNTLELGRYIQLTFNALTIPLVYLLAREINFSRWMSVGTAIVLSVFRGYWEHASHFFPDSQFTFLLALSCLLFTKTFRDGYLSYWYMVSSALVLALTALTREHAPVMMFVPFSYLSLSKVMAGKITIRDAILIAILHVGTLTIGYYVMIKGVFLPRSDIVLATLGIVPSGGPQMNNEMVHRTLSNIIPRISDFRFGLSHLVRGVGESVDLTFLVFAPVGMLAGGGLMFSRFPGDRHNMMATFQDRSIMIRGLQAGILVLGFGCLAHIVVAPFSLPLAVPFVIGLTYIAWRLCCEQARCPNNLRHLSLLFPPYGRVTHDTKCHLVFYGLLTLSVVLVNMAVAPAVSRFFFPVYPFVAMFSILGMISVAEIGLFAVFAILYGVGSLSVGLARPMTVFLDDGMLRLIRTAISLHWFLLGLLVLSYLIVVRRAASDRNPYKSWQIHALPMMILVLCFVLPFSRYSLKSFLYGGYPSDAYFSVAHGGIRWRLLNDLKPWLEENVSADNHILTNYPNLITWASKTGLRGLYNSLYAGQTPEELSSFFKENDLGLLDVDYIIEFNPYLHQGADPVEYRAWVNIYNMLAARGDLQEVYHRESSEGKLGIYVFKKTKH